MKKQSQPRSLTSLPDEIIENCLARISRWNYTFLSLVSKKFHSILSSKELYMTRSQIGSHETYICLRVPDPASPRWFSLWPKPNLTPTKRKYKKNSSGNLLVPIPSSSSSPSPPVVPCTSTIAVGSEIYVISGDDENGPASSVWILDCISHTWREAPNMNSARSFASANLLDEKIYVMGGCEFANSWMEVFDIKTQSWTSFPSPCDQNELSEDDIVVNVVEGKLHVVLGTKEYTYEPKEATWKFVREPSTLLEKVEAWCVVENVIYCCIEDGYFMRYDYKVGKLEAIKGNLKELRTRGLSNGNVVDMINRDGKLLVIWEPKLKSCRRSSRKNKIWYAEISLETLRTCNGSEIWGKIECVDMLTVPRMSFSDLELCLNVLV